MVGDFNAVNLPLLLLFFAISLTVSVLRVPTTLVFERVLEEIPSYFLFSLQFSFF